MTAASTTTLPPSVETLREQLDDAAKHIGMQRERIKELEAEVTAHPAKLEAMADDARHEGHEEGYSEGAADQAGWASDTAQAVLRWLDKEGDGFDINHPDGNTTDAIIQGLYDAKRAGNFEELRRLKAALTGMCDAYVALLCMKAEDPSRFKEPGSPYANALAALT